MASVSTYSRLAADPDNASEWQLTQLRSQQTAPSGDKSGIIFSHGASLTTVSTDPGFAAQAQQCPVWPSVGGAGSPAISRNFAGNHWGSDTGITRMDQAYTWHQTQGAKSGPVAIIGFSMGGLLALNYASRNPTHVTCCLLICPVLSLIAVHDGNIGGYQATIETAYGGSVAYAAAANAHDPLTFMANLVTPLRIYYSTNDSFCTPAYVASITGGSSGHVESASMGAAGHTMTPVPGSEALTFIQTYTP